jgi:hypothetical protein
VDDLTLEQEVEKPVDAHQHPLDPISLALGTIFVIPGAVFLFGDVNATDLNLAWAGAGLFGAIGLLLIALGLKRHARRN